MAVSALVWLYGQSLFQRADIGVSAWLVMPVLLFLGWRYGLFASALALSGLGALTVLVLVSGPPPTIGDLVQRQAVGALLMTVSLTTVILWSGGAMLSPWSRPRNGPNRSKSRIAGGDVRPVARPHPADRRYRPAGGGGERGRRPTARAFDRRGGDTAVQRPHRSRRPAGGR